MNDETLRTTSAYERQQASLEQAAADRSKPRSRARRQALARRDLWLQLADEIDAYLDARAALDQQDQLL